MKNIKKFWDISYKKMKIFYYIQMKISSVLPTNILIKDQNFS